MFSQSNHWDPVISSRCPYMSKSLGREKSCFCDMSLTMLKTIKLAVTMLKSGVVVGYAPKTLVTVFWSEVLIKVLSRLQQRLNCGSGHGVEAPCINWLYSPEAYLRHLKELVHPAGWAAAKVSIKEGPEETQSQPIWEWLFLYLIFFCVCIKFYCGANIILSAVLNMALSIFRGF